MDEAQITRTGAPPWLAVLVVVLALAAGVALVVSAGGGPSDAIEEPAPVPPPTVPERADPGALRPDGAPSRGSGQVVAVSPDGEWLYTLDRDPRGGIGCEDYPRQRLHVEPTDQAVGVQRQPALRQLTASIEAWTTLTFGPERSVALVSRCEESLTAFGTAAIAADGTMVELRWLDLTEQLPSIVDLDWTSAGRMIVSTYGLGPAPGPEGRGLYEVDVATGGFTPLDADGVMYLDVTADGRLVTRDNVGAVRAGDEVLGSEGEVHGLATSADGRFVVTTGARGVTVYDTETGRDERIADTPAFSPSVLGTGDVVFHTRDGEGVGRVVAVHLGAVGEGDHPLATLFSDEGVGRLTSSAVAPDGTHLWVTYLEEQSEGDPLPVLLGQPLTR